LPVKRDFSLHLELKEMLRRAGARDSSKVRPEIRNTILDLLTEVKDTCLLEPSVAYEFYKKDDITRGHRIPTGNKMPDISLFTSIFPDAREFAVVVCTIGPRLEKQATDCFNDGEPLRGMLMDGIGSAAVDMLSQEICRFIAENASSRGYQASSPINPGMPKFPITGQYWLLELVPSREIGVSLTDSGIMVPRKSTSMVIGLGPQMKTWSQSDVCEKCSLRETCHYRIVT
jgi:hypothetical protein